MRASSEGGNPYAQKRGLAKRRRPWQKALGALVLIAAVAFAILNELKKLPGGHSEVYLVVAVLVSGCVMWWLGALSD